VAVKKNLSLSCRREVAVIKSVLQPRPLPMKFILGSSTPWYKSLSFKNFSNTWVPIQRDFDFVVAVMGYHVRYKNDSLEGFCMET
jgi:hypothetical protein